MKNLVFLVLFFLHADSLADPLGRLFFTKKEREAMDRQSRNHGRAIQENPEASGVIERKGGGKTVWIGGVPRHVERETKK
ncbi:MAG TPA: hypothetical protein PLK99_08905 [Burkholderiales bacterium]|nr:hypothetical protein [Burkholderiales bacterium]